MLKADAHLLFAPDAAGYHHLVMSLDRLLQRKAHEGGADVRLVRRHPELYPTTDLVRFERRGSWLNRRMRLLAFGHVTRGMNAPRICGGL